MARIIKTTNNYSIQKNMQVFLIHPRGGKTKAFSLRNGVFVSLALFGLISMGVFSLGAKYGSYAERHFVIDTGFPEKHTTSGKRDTENKIDALTLKLGQLQSQMVRLNIIGRRVVEELDIGNGEFDFSEFPAMGGMEAQNSASSQSYDELVRRLSSFTVQMQERELQLKTLDELLTKREVGKETFPAGSPAIDGWQTSTFGWRTDPFHGRRTFHHGVDFAGRQGSDIVAVASGLVIGAGREGGYGNLVEIDHGGGNVTRYAHNKDIAVVVGDAVSKGQVIAHMGSTGHSTGTHVHFEVIQNGIKVNPIKFVRGER